MLRFKFLATIFAFAAIFGSVPTPTFASDCMELASVAAIVEPGQAPGIREAGNGELKPGINHFTFDGWAGKPIPAFVFVPSGVDVKKAPIMFMMHGAKRGAVRYLKEWVPHAEKKGVVIIAPKFSKKHFKYSRQYQAGNVFGSKSKGSKYRPEEQWTFSTIEPLFDEVVKRLDSTTKDYTLYGHSAGSQFAHRFLFYKPDARAKRIIAANAGWYTMPWPKAAFPYGLKNAKMPKGSFKKALAKDVYVILGDQDNDAKHESLRKTPEANRQGAHRFARGVNFFREGKKQAKRMKIKFGWKVVVVKGVAHSNGEIAAVAIKFVE